MDTGTWPWTYRTVSIKSTHGAADDVVLVRVPTDVPHTRIVTRQSGDHGACQHVVNYKHTHTPAVSGDSLLPVM